MDEQANKVIGVVVFLFFFFLKDNFKGTEVENRNGFHFALIAESSTSFSHWELEAVHCYVGFMPSSQVTRHRNAVFG